MEDGESTLSLQVGFVVDGCGREAQIEEAAHIVTRGRHEGRR